MNVAKTKNNSYKKDSVVKGYYEGENEGETYQDNKGSISFRDGFSDVIYPLFDTTIKGHAISMQGGDLGGGVVLRGLRGRGSPRDLG